MIRTPDRREATALIKEAVSCGARSAIACKEIGITLRTFQRWMREGENNADRRPGAKKRRQANKLSEEEREKIIRTLNREEYRSMPPSQVVPDLADKGTYIASESTMYRVLRERSMQHHRGREKAPRNREVTGHLATGPNQVWSWDITWLSGPVKGLFLYLYMIIDIFSRKIVGWEVYESESAEHASAIFNRASLAERPHLTPMVIHSDNGSPMKSSTLLATLDRLGISPSYSRPGVSNDNPYSESLFRTLKYRPSYPYKGFSNMEDARKWCMEFTLWYNNEHRHKNLNYVTPSQRHNGEAESILAKRKQVYEEAKKKNPLRWSGNTRDCSLDEGVWLNRKNNAGGHAHNGKIRPKNSRQLA
jgi:putative transposase